MLMAMSMSELRAQLPRVLDRVEAGEDVVDTRHGKAIAVLVAPERVHGRAAEAHAVADDLEDRLEQARRRPLAPAALSEQAAGELLADVARSREPR